MSQNSEFLSPFKIPPKKVPHSSMYSPFEWNNLQVPPVSPSRISSLELSQHASSDDCWIAIQGKVYNITPYVKYHPGGVEQIMRGIGIDATELFMQVHPWVNPDALLKKCFLGFLTPNR